MDGNMDLYRDFCRQAVWKDVPPGRIVLAVSGGADSVCLLHLVSRLARERKWRIEVVHAQHHLRGRESDRDEKFVLALCARLDLPCAVRHIYPAKHRGTEEKSRILRYRALRDHAGRVGARAVLTAHNANDQAETLLLNLIRGAARQGLAGMRLSRPLSDVTGDPGHDKVLLVRPLLPFPRSRIEAYLKGQKLSYRTDSSNLRLRYRRNWVRRKLVPLLESVQPGLVERLSGLAGIFQQEEDWLDQQARRLRRDALFETENGGKRLDLRRFFRYHMALRTRLLHQFWPQASSKAIVRIHDFLAKRKGSVALDRLRGEVLAAARSPRLKSGTRFSVPGRSVLKDWNLRLSSEYLSWRRGLARRSADGGKLALFDADKLRRGGAWRLRRWKPGDRFRPFGMAGSKKLQDFFVDSKVARELRSEVPILEQDGKIRWVVGLRTDDESKVDDRTRRVLRISVSPL